MGLIKDKSSIGICEKLSVSAFCRRRLPIILKNLKFIETIKEGVTFIEQGRKQFNLDIRIGTEVVSDPALLVTRQMVNHLYKGGSYLMGWSK